MQAIFMARGPAFQTNKEIRSLKNVDVYHIVCRILGITPNAHATAGSLDNLAHIFQPDPTTTPPTSTIPDRFTKPVVEPNVALRSVSASYEFYLLFFFLSLLLLR